MNIYKTIIVTSFVFLLGGCEYGHEVDVKNSNIHMPSGYSIVTGKTMMITRSNESKGISYSERPVYGHFVSKRGCENAVEVEMGDSRFLPGSHQLEGVEDESSIMDYCIESNKDGAIKLYVKPHTVEKYKYDAVIADVNLTIFNMKKEYGDDLRFVEKETKLREDIKTSWGGKLPNHIN